MGVIRSCLVVLALSLGLSGAPPDNSLKATPDGLFAAFQEAIIGLVIGDSKTVLRYSSVHYLQAIVDQNRKDLVKYRNDAVVRKAFEDLTGRPFDELLTLSDRDLAVVVIDRFIPSTRTEDEKNQLVTAMRQAVLLEHAEAAASIRLSIAYRDGSREQAIFIQEGGVWRLDEIR